MAKTLDYIALTVFITIIAFVFGALILDNLTLAIILACALSTAITFSIKYYTRRKYRYSPHLLATHFTIQGNEYVIKLLKSVIGNDGIEQSSNYLFISDCMIASCYKFGMISSQDVATLSKEAINHGATTIYVLGYGIDRKAYQVANFMQIRIKLIKISAIYRYLAKHNALPDLSKKRPKFSLRAIFETVLSKSNIKYYAFSGIVLILTSFITPLKLYYLITGSILILLAIFSVLFGNGNFNSNNPFKIIENAVHEDCADNNNDSKGAGD